MKSKNWIWWTLGGIAAIGVGVGTYMYIRSKKGAEDQNTGGTAPIAPMSNPTPSSGGGTNTSSPFANKAEGDAFRGWVNDNYPDYAKEIDLDRSGSHTNSFIMKAWTKYGQAYQQAKGAGTSITPTAPTSSTLSTIQSQMLDTKTWGATSRVSENSSSKLRIGIDVVGFKDIYVNFTPNGGFWMEKFAGSKYDGSWKLENGKFMVSLADGSYSGSDANIAVVVKAAMKKKFPEEMAYFQFTEEKANLDDMMNMSGKNYVDSQDSML
jgi:hypothetical protein